MSVLVIIIQKPSCINMKRNPNRKKNWHRVHWVKYTKANSEQNKTNERNSPSAVQTQETVKKYTHESTNPKKMCIDWFVNNTGV